MPDVAATKPTTASASASIFSSGTCWARTLLNGVLRPLRRMRHDRKLERKIFNPDLLNLKAPRAYGALLAFFVIHDQHGTVLQLNCRRVSPWLGVDLERTLPGPGLVPADVQRGGREPVRE